MKLTFILITATLLNTSIKVVSQSISFKGKNVGLQEIFSSIEKQTGFAVFCNAELLDKAKPVTLSVVNIPLRDFLHQAFKNQPLDFSIKNTTIVISGRISSTYLSDFLPPIRIKVVDTDGKPLAGATISVKNSSRSGITDAEGVSSINVSEGDVLVISYVGFESAEYKITKAAVASSDRQLKISLDKKNNDLNEVIVRKGYYDEKKTLTTGNVNTVTAEDIEKQPVQNPLLALQGRVPGLFIMQPSGVSGTSVRVRIQGQNSFRNGNEPLYVIDGIPIDAQLPSTGIDLPLSLMGANISSGPNGSGAGNPLNYINPGDIEAIDILKDADATAIYGSRAANGAILITTKKGKAGPLKLDMNIQKGWGKMTRRLNMLNTRQYLDMRYEAFANDNINWQSTGISANDLKVWDTTRYTNWQDELLGGTAGYTDLYASVSGGSTAARYFISGTYHKETTVFPLPDDFADQKGAVHVNFNSSSRNKRFKLQFSNNFMIDNNQLPQSDLTLYGLLLEPNAPALLNPDGSINWAPDAGGNTTWGDGGGNVMLLRYQKYVNKTYNLFSNLTIGYTILPHLELKGSMGYNYMQTNDFSPDPLIAVAPEKRATAQRYAAFGDRNIQSLIVEPQASYWTNIYKGKLELLIGSTFQDRKAKVNSLTGLGQDSDESLKDIHAATSVFSSNSISRYKYQAVSGRVNYNWADKYVMNITLRRDGSTRFGAANRFHNFGAIGAAWIFSNETFFASKKDIVNFGKLRGSYGTTGSDQISDQISEDQFMSLYKPVFYAPVPYQGVAALVPAGLPNPDLQWEETRKLQIGIDLGFLQDKIVFNATYVRNRSSNQLLSSSVPYTTGFSSYLINFPAIIQNRNWELMVTGKLLQKKEVSWTSSINLTIPQNKLVTFPGLSVSSQGSFSIVGEPIDIDRYYPWKGVSPSTGNYLYADHKGTLTTSPNPDVDRTGLYSHFPKLYGGFQHSISYKRLQVDFLFQFVKQIGYNDMAFWNGYLYPGQFHAGYSNQPVTVLNRWQKVGDNRATIAKFQTSRLDGNIISSDRRFMDASYIRLKNLSVSWDLPRRWVDKAHFKSFRVYVHGQNLLTITGYKGLDPETNWVTALPPLRMWTTGLQVGL